MVDVSDVSALRQRIRMAQGVPKSETGTGSLEAEAEHVVGTNSHYRRQHCLSVVEEGCAWHQIEMSNKFSPAWLLAWCCQAT